VAGEVIPTIRKMDRYGAPPVVASAVNGRDPARLAAIALRLVELNRELKERVGTPEPEAHDHLAASGGAEGVTDVLTTSKLTPRALSWSIRRG
jgi:hypothetical protein